MFNKRIDYCLKKGKIACEKEKYCRFEDNICKTNTPVLHCAVQVGASKAGT